MRVRLKRKVSILIVMAMFAGIIAMPGEQEVIGAETETASLAFVTEEEATAETIKEIKVVEKQRKNSIKKVAAREISAETTESTTETEVTTEEISSEETTVELTSPEVTTISEVTTTEVTTIQPKKPKKIKWNGKVVSGATMKGIDVSHHNGKIDWKKVKASDVDYAIIRCGYGTNRKSQDDRQWKNNVKGCEKNKIPYGVYIYSYAMTADQARSEAAHVLRLIQGHKLSFPIYFDMEEPSQERLPLAKRQKIIETFLNIIRDNGYECGVYANLNWWNNYIYTLADKVFYKWVAQYNKKCAYKGVYQMWQCSPTEKVSGIIGNVDLNFWYDTVRDSSYDIYDGENIKRPKSVTVKKVSAGWRTATITWKRQSKAVGYRVQYSTSKKFKRNKSQSTSGNFVTIKNLKSKKIYYFRIKAYKYKNGKKLYSKEWSKIVKKKIK